MGKKVLEAATKQQRAKVRKTLGTLKSLTVQPATKRRYNDALDRFFKFLRKEQLSLPTKRESLDPLVADYLEVLWSSGEGRALASDTLAALQDADPKIKGHLPTSWRLLKVWCQNELPNRAPPMPEPILLAMVGYNILKEHHLFALSLLLGFYGLLRTGEILNLQKHQVEVGSARSPAILSLGLTKGGKRAGSAECVTIHVAEVTRRLTQWKSSGPPSLVPSPSKWRTQFSATLAAIGAESFGFRPYSLRRGGATFFFTKHGSMDRLMIQGRWVAQKTARIYINSGLATLAELKLPKKRLNPFINVYHQSQHHALPPLERT